MCGRCEGVQDGLNDFCVFGGPGGGGVFFLYGGVTGGGMLRKGWWCINHGGSSARPDWTRRARRDHARAGTRDGRDRGESPALRQVLSLVRRAVSRRPRRACARSW